MAKLSLTPENQIQRLNIVLNNVKSLQELDADVLTNVSIPDTWSIIEVLSHLNIAYGHYQNKFNEVIPRMTNLNEEQKPFRTRPWQKMIIEMQRPKGTQRKWKMKTMKRFEPLLDRKNMGKEKVEEIFHDFFELHGHLKDSILKSRNKDISKTKINSGIGPIVKFYLPESFEFLLCHLERHMVQVDKILNQQKVLTQ